MAISFKCSKWHFSIHTKWYCQHMLYACGALVFSIWQLLRLSMYKQHSDLSLNKSVRCSSALHIWWHRLHFIDFRWTIYEYAYYVLLIHLCCATWILNDSMRLYTIHEQQLNYLQLFNYTRSLLMPTIYFNCGEIFPLSPLRVRVLNEQLCAVVLHFGILCSWRCRN